MIQWRNEEANYTEASFELQAYKHLIVLWKMDKIQLSSTGIQINDPTYKALISNYTTRYSKALIDECINANCRVGTEIQDGVLNWNDTSLTPHSY